MGLNSGRLITNTAPSATVDTSTLTGITGVVAGDGTNIIAATATEGDALPVTGGTLGAQLSAKANKTQEAWIEPTLVNNWVPFDATDDSVVKYYKDNFGVVHLAGLLKTGEANTSPFTFPVGYRPETLIYFTTRSSGRAVIDPYLGTNGVFYPTAVSYSGYIVLNGLNFKAVPA